MDNLRLKKKDAHRTPLNRHAHVHFQDIIR